MSQRVLSSSSTELSEEKRLDKILEVKRNEIQAVVIVIAILAIVILVLAIIGLFNSSAFELINPIIAVLGGAIGYFAGTNKTTTV